jgi:TatD DNase family protein
MIAPPELVDIGVNLGHRSFAKDLDEVLLRARAAGVVRMIVTGTSVPASQEALALARAHGLYATAGVHPHDAARCGDDTIDALRRLHEDPRVVAVGECGLDFNRDFSPRPVQEKWLEAQIALACELGKPLFLHERDAHARLVEILDRFSPLPPVVVHCFTGGEAELDAYLARGYSIGITGWVCDPRRGSALQAVVPRIPVDRLMLETDAPYLTPRDVPGLKGHGRNEPAWLVHVLATVARCAGRPAEHIAAETTANARQFFGLE